MGKITIQSFDRLIGEWITNPTTNHTEWNITDLDVTSDKYVIGLTPMDTTKPIYVIINRTIKYDRWDSGKIKFVNAEVLGLSGYVLTMSSLSSIDSLKWWIGNQLKNLKFGRMAKLM